MKSALVPSGDSDAGGGPVMPVTLGPQVFVIDTPPRPPRPAPPARPGGAAGGAPPGGGTSATPRVFRTGLTMTISEPVAVVRRYQKLPSASHVTVAVPPTTRPLRAGASMRTARS